MDNTKLNALAARVMDLTPLAQTHGPQLWYLRPDKTVVEGWYPATCADDALVLLEKVAQGKGYSIYMFPEEKNPYDVELEVDKRCTDERTLPLAMTVAALRAAGISESEIQDALP